MQELGSLLPSSQLVIRLSVLAALLAVWCINPTETRHGDLLTIIADVLFCNKVFFFFH